MLCLWGILTFLFLLCALALNLCLQVRLNGRKWVAASLSEFSFRNMMAVAGCLVQALRVAQLNSAGAAILRGAPAEHGRAML